MRLAKLFPVLAMLGVCAVSGLSQTRQPSPPRARTRPPSPTRTELIPELNLQTWRELVSPAGRFTISFPSQPVPQIGSTSTNVTVRSFVTRTRLAGYFVSYADVGEHDTLPDERAIRERLFGNSERGLSETFGGTIVETRDIRLANQHPGRAFVLDTREGLVSMRLYLVNRRLYHLMVFRGHDSNAPAQMRAQYNAAAEHFFNSFRLTTESEARESGERYGTTRLTPPAALPPPRPADTTPLDRGTLEGTVYTNRFFNFRFEFPSYWESLDTALMRSLIFDAADELVSADANNQRYSAAMRESLNRSTVLFAIAHAETGARGGTSIIACIAERLPPVTPIRNERDFVQAIRNFNRRLSTGDSTNRIEFSDTSGQMTLGGKRFEYIDAIVTHNGETSRERYYVTLIRGYALYFISSYQTETQLEAIEEILSRMRFNPVLPPVRPEPLRPR